jgi:hypothetical protein
MPLAASAWLNRAATAVVSAGGPGSSGADGLTAPANRQLRGRLRQRIEQRGNEARGFAQRRHRGAPRSGREARGRRRPALGIPLDHRQLQLVAGPGVDRQRNGVGALADQYLVHAAGQGGRHPRLQLRPDRQMAQVSRADRGSRAAPRRR